ncbi:MAG TPA: hypothetical protein VNB28_10150 [Methylomirabilota bacterium]|jgi:hypothetical protein|nr:hypothetical protein [Methylomirabilota bacterium]
MVGHEQGRRELGRRLIGLSVAVLAVAFLLLWAWNGTAVELMGAAPAGFRHAVSFAAAIAGIAALTVAAARLAGAKTTRDGGGSA